MKTDNDMINDMILDDIKRAGERLGACPLLRSVQTEEELLELFFAPEGREFCQSNSFPSLDLIRKIDRSVARKHGVYIDAGIITVDAYTDLAFIGDTIASVRVSGQVASWRATNVIAMHGARLDLTAISYAVVLATTIGESKIMPHAENGASIFFDEPAR